MAIGPLGRGVGRVFRVTPGTQQLPFPGMVQMPSVVPMVPPRPLPPRAARPLPPDPRDVLFRPSLLERQADEMVSQLLRASEDPYAVRRRTQAAPYSLVDPVTGQETNPVWDLVGPRKIQTDVLLQSAEDDGLDYSFGIVLDTLKRAQTPEELYPVLVQLNALRNRYGNKVTLGGSGRIVKGSAGEEGGTAGVRALASGGEESFSVSEIPKAIESAINTEVWRAAYRVGIPESELGKWQDAFEALDLKGVGTKAVKTPLVALAKKVSTIRNRANNTPQAIAKSLSDLEEIIAPDGPMIKAGLSPEDIDFLAQQVIYAQNRLGIGETGLRLAAKHVGTGLPEDKLHSLIVAAMKGASSNDEINAIKSIARGEIKSVTFLDDIEDESLQNIARLIRAANPDDPSTIARVVPRETPNERWVRGFETRRRPEFYPKTARGLETDPAGLRYTPGPQVIAGDRIFSTYSNQDLFDTIGKDVSIFGPRRNFRSFEAYDPESGEFVHRLMRWNQEAKKWEEIDTTNAVRGPRSSYRTPPVDGRTGKFVRGEGEFVEFQGFTQRVQTPLPKQAVELSTPDLVMETIRGLGIRYDLPREQVQKVAKSAADLVKKLESDGVIAAGTAQYTWVTGVFPRIALQVSGPGYNVTKVRGLVSHDANFTRRQAALVAFNNAESAGLVPAEIAGYIRKMNPGTETYEQLLEQARQAFATRRAAGSTTQQVRRAQRVMEESEESSVAAERAAIQKIMKESEAASERLAKKATS